MKLKDLPEFISNLDVATIGKWIIIGVIVYAVFQILFFVVGVKLMKWWMK